MKCIGCGADVDVNVKKCPYCGVVNTVAIEREQIIDDLEEKNEKLKKSVLQKSWFAIYYKIHKRINLLLVIAFFLIIVIGVIVAENTDNKNPGRGSRQNVIEAYNRGDYEALYMAMRDGEYFEDPEYDEYGHMAMIWDCYIECLAEYGRTYDEYLKTGKYDRFYLKSSVMSGVEVLYGIPTLYYYKNELSAENARRAKPMQDEIRALFIGVYKVPEEMLDTTAYTKSKMMSELEDYVLGVLENE